MKTLFVSLCIFFGLAMILFKDKGRLTSLDTPAKQTQVKMAEIGRALEAYYADCDTYPNTLEQLTIKPKSCPKWGPMPYMKKDFTDAWVKSLCTKKATASTI